MEFLPCFTISINRGIEIDRIDVEFSILACKGEIEGAQAKLRSIPENGKSMSNAIEFSIAFDHRDRSKHRNRSTRRWRTEFGSQRRNQRRANKVCLVPENSDASITLSPCKHTIKAEELSITFDRLDRSRVTTRNRTRNRWAGCAGLDWLD